jgi:hypothetical protein
MAQKGKTVNKCDAILSRFLQYVLNMSLLISTAKMYAIVSWEDCAVSFSPICLGRGTNNGRNGTDGSTE